MVAFIHVYVYAVKRKERRPGWHRGGGTPVNQWTEPTRVESAKTSRPGTQYVSAEELGRLRQEILDAIRVEQDDVVCLECGRAGLRQLGTHLRREHNLSVAGYKTKYGYRRHRRGLIAPSLHKHLAAKKKTRRAFRHLALIRPAMAKVTQARLASRWKIPREYSLKRAHMRRPSLDLQKVGDWKIASCRLEGMTTMEICQSVGLKSRGSVEARLKRMGFPVGSKKPVAFWRGEPATAKLLLNMMSDFSLTRRELASQMKLGEERVGRPLLKVDALLSPDTAGRVKKLYGRLRSGRGLLQSERADVRMKYPPLLVELQLLRTSLQNTAGCDAERVGEFLCHGARRGKIRLLLFWAREFLPWYANETDFQALQAASWIASELAYKFLGAEYKVSPELVRQSVSNRERGEEGGPDRRGRLVLFSTRSALSGRPRISSRELVEKLRTRPALRSINQRELASLLSFCGARPRNLWESGTVVKGYAAEDLRTYTTREAAEELRVHRTTLQRWVRVGAVPGPPKTSGAGPSSRVWINSDVERVRRYVAAHRAKFHPLGSGRS